MSGLFTNRDEDKTGKEKLCTCICLKKPSKQVSPTLAALMFSCSKDYQALHSAHLLTDAIIKAIELEVPGMGDYL